MLLCVSTGRCDNGKFLIVFACGLLSMKMESPNVQNTGSVCPNIPTRDTLLWRIHIQKFPGPPTGPNSFILTYIFVEKCLRRSLAPPTGNSGSAPALGTVAGKEQKSAGDAEFKSKTRAPQNGPNKSFKNIHISAVFH